MPYVGWNMHRKVSSKKQTVFTSLDFTEVMAWCVQVSDGIVPKKHEMKLLVSGPTIPQGKIKTRH